MIIVIFCLSTYLIFHLAADEDVYFQPEEIQPQQSVPWHLLSGSAVISATVALSPRHCPPEPAQQQEMLLKHQYCQHQRRSWQQYVMHTEELNSTNQHFTLAYDTYTQFLNH